MPSEISNAIRVAISFNFKTMCTVRWLLTVPIAVIGWYIGVVAALLIHWVNERLCPAEYVVSGMCDAPWSSFVSDFALALGASICGSLTVLLPTLIAPSSRGRVALLAFASGLACSAYWAFHGVWVPVAWAALAGAVTLWRIQTVVGHANRSA